MVKNKNPAKYLSTDLSSSYMIAAKIRFFKVYKVGKVKSF